MLSQILNTQPVIRVQLANPPALLLAVAWQSGSGRRSSGCGRICMTYGTHSIENDIGKELAAPLCAGIGLFFFMITNNLLEKK